MSSSANQGSEDHFEESGERFEAVVLRLEGEEAIALEQSGLDAQLEAKGRELLRRLFQDQLDLRASNEVRVNVVVGAEGVGRGSVEADHETIPGHGLR